MQKQSHLSHQQFVYTYLNDQTVLFLTIRNNVSHLFTYSLNVWPIDRTLSGATTPGQSGPESDGNEEVYCIPKMEPRYQIF